MIITELLAILSISAAAGFRLALPLLLIGLLSGNLWSEVPLLSQVPPRVVLGLLVSWSLLELILSKDRPLRRLFPTLQILFSPIVGAIAGITVGRILNVSGTGLLVVEAVLGGGLALVMQLVQLGWIYRVRTPPLWAVFLQDFLCICLVLFAFDAPRQGGVIALLLLWLALRTSTLWRRWYLEQAAPAERRSPRRLKREPD
ncbi:MAG: DUF4126 domain-containing protein [Leptolyngbya sp.]|nr:DUF4126 domain-containing protein [Leptolyngbya sp.]